MKDKMTGITEKSAEARYTGHWNFHLFGGFRVEHEGVTVKAPPYRCRATLTYLLLNIDRSIRREKITGELYPDLPAHRARARLSDHFWLIKSSLPGLVIENQGDEIRISSKQVWADCQAFSAGVSQNEPGVRYETLKLYKGDFAPDLYDDWVMLERERFRNAYLNSLSVLAAMFEKEGQYLRLSEMLGRLLAEEPYEEAAVRQLMRVYIQLGRRGLALSTYERFRLLCIEQFRTEPESETQMLFESILARTTLPLSSFAELHERPSGDANALLQQAETALAQGDRFQLLNLLCKLSAQKDPVLALRRELLYVDEALQWNESSKAAQRLDTLTADSGQVELRRAILFLEQKNYECADQALARVLKLASHTSDHALEARTLVYLSSAKLQRASFQEALLAINRAIQIASQLDQPELIARSCLQKGRILFKQGLNHDAQDVLLQAHVLAENHHLKGLLVEINFLIASSFQRLGRYRGAYKIYARALEAARDIGLKKIEAQILLGQAAVCDFLGQNIESRQSLNAARNIFADLNDQIGLAIVDYNLAAALPYHDEKRCGEAIAYARAAIKIFTESAQAEWQAVAYTALAFALWVAGQYQAAIVNYKKSIELHQALGENTFIPELYAYIGLAHLGVGELTTALDLTEQACYEQSLLNLSDIVTDIFYARGAALEHSGKLDEARHFYLKAYNTLLDYAKDIEDEPARQAYFHRDPITRRLMQKIQALGLAPAIRQVIIQRHIVGRPGEKVDIAITVDTGAPDRALAQGQGDIALRHTRLKRILAQAEAQNTHLTLAEMARALNVSQRTVQRDLETLNARTSG